MSSTVMDPSAEASSALAVLGTLSDACFRIDRQWVIRYANPSAVQLLQRQVDPVVGANARAIFPDAFGATFDRAFRRAIDTSVPGLFEEQYLPLNTWLEVRIYPDDHGATVLIHDAAERRAAAALLEDQTRVLERVARGRPTRDVLEAITGLIERHGQGMLCGVYSADDRGEQLILAAGPSLPQDLSQSVETVDIRADGPAIARAAAATQPVESPDLLLEPAEPKYRDSAVRNGLRAVWGMPVASSEGSLLGVLVVWRRDAGGPTPTDRQLLKTGSQLAGIALEQRQVEADLRHKEQEYRAIIETVQDALFVSNTHGDLVEANPAACKQHGSSYETLIRKNAAELVRADYHGVLRRLLDDVRQGKQFHADLAMVRKDGSSFPAEVTAVPFQYKGQRHLLAMARDISSRKKMEDSLHGSEERLRTVANAAPIVLFAIDRNGIFTLSEGLALSSLGLRAGEVVGKSVFEMYHAHPDILANIRMALSGEARRWTAELGEHVFETTARPLRSSRGEIIGLVGVAVDTTEQAITLEALRTSEERFRANFHQAPVGVAHSGLDGRIIRVNDRLAKLLGARTDELVGHTLAEWYVDAQPDADPALVHKLLTEGAGFSTATRTLRLATGQSQQVIVSLSLGMSRLGEPRHVITAVTLPA